MHLTLVITGVTMSSLELVDYINADRADGAATLDHADFLKKVPKVLGDDAGNFSAVYKGGNGKATESHKPSEFLSSQGIRTFVAALGAENIGKAENPTSVKKKRQRRQGSRDLRRRTRFCVGCSPIQKSCGSFRGVSATRGLRTASFDPAQVQNNVLTPDVLT